jgi:pyridoxamine 5'-phosphate oxidase
MIEFNNLSQETPYLIFKENYYKALGEGQKSIEAISVSSYNREKKEVDSRFVNLKFINDSKFIFFSNYKSPKSVAFKSNNQISILIYWESIKMQIRMKAKIQKTSIEFNNEYFQSRSLDKNALAISSNQSQISRSYEQVIEEYKNVKENQDLTKCPDYWGGFSFTPYYFEFWEGHSSRLNKREVYKSDDNIWSHYILQP